MLVARPAAALLAVLALVLTATAAAAPSRTAVAPTGLHGFLLRADEPPTDSFSRTPAFAWNPVPGATSYEFQLSTSSAFRDSGVVYSAGGLTSPVVAPPVTLPWITGSPHALYARVRAVLQSTSSAWSDSFGFNMTPVAPPKPVSSYPGLLRWTPVQGADAYEVWLIDANKRVDVYTNVLDEREFYTFHQSQKWIGTVRWRIRAIRNDLQGRTNGIPAIRYGTWSPIYTSSNPAFATGPIKLVGTISDVFSNGDPATPAHRLMPAFVFTGDQTQAGADAELYRIYVFTDQQCINRVFTSSVIGSPAYSPRPFGPLALPTSPAALPSVRGAYLPDGVEGPGFSYDGDQVTSTESLPPATPTTTVPAASTDSTGAPAGGGSPGISWQTSNFGAPVDLWDTEWPQGGYYWTVIPVAAVSPGSISTNVATPGATATGTALPATNSGGFSAGDTVLVGNATNQETGTVTGVAAGSLTLASPLKFAHGAGEPIVRTGGNLQYRDLELPQDVCAAGRVARFGKDSEPSLVSAGDLFASGLSPSGRLTSARHTAAFYGAPLVAWTPALGATVYEVQWSKTRYPFQPEPDPRSGTAGFLTASTSAVLPLKPGVWYYRVRGFDYSLPTDSQPMSWSDPAKIVVTKPTFKILP